MSPLKSMNVMSMCMWSFFLTLSGVAAFMNQAAPFGKRYVFSDAPTSLDGEKGIWTKDFQAQSHSSRLGKHILFSTETPASDDMDDAFDIYENEYFMDELRLRIAKSQVFGPGMEDRPKPKEVFIILFEKDTDNEGVHSIEFPKGSGNNVLLAFESLEQSEIFANTLKNQHFLDPQPTEIPLKDLEEFSGDANVEIQIVPKGTSINPPTENVDTFDHDPHFHQTKSKLESLLDLTFESEKDDAFGSWE